MKVSIRNRAGNIKEYPECYSYDLVNNGIFMHLRSNVDVFVPNDRLIEVVIEPEEGFDK